MIENDITIVEYNKILREMVRHENELSNQRLTWITTLNGLMFTALGVILNGKDHYIKIPDHIFITGFSLLGIVVSYSGLVALDMAEDSKERFKNLWNNKNISVTKIPPIWGDINRSKFERYFLPWHIIPKSLMVFWFLLLGLNFVSFISDFLK